MTGGERLQGAALRRSYAAWGGEQAGLCVAWAPRGGPRGVECAMSCASAGGGTGLCMPPTGCMAWGRCMGRAIACVLCSPMRPQVLEGLLHKAREMEQDMSTADVVSSFIVPKTQQNKCR